MTQQHLVNVDDKLINNKALLMRKSYNVSSQKLSALLNPINNNISSSPLIKNHSVSSPNIKHYINLNHSNQHLLNKQRQIQKRKQVYKFFNEQKSKITQKQRQLGYLLPKITYNNRTKHSHQLQQSTKLSNLFMRDKGQQGSSNNSLKKNNIRSKQKSIQQQRKLKTEQKKQLTLDKQTQQMQSYRKKCQYELSKIKLTLPKFIQKKQRFFNLSSNIVQELFSNQYNEEEKCDNDCQDKINLQQQSVKQQKQQNKLKKFYLIKHNQRNSSTTNEIIDSTIPQFLMQRLSVNKSPSLRKISFMTQIDSNQNSPKHYSTINLKKQKIFQKLR